MQLFRSMVVEQVGDAFAKAVSFDIRDGQGQHAIIVQSRTTLQQPKSEFREVPFGKSSCSVSRPAQAGSPSRPSVPPPYSVSQVYSTLSAFGTLTSTLNTLRTKIVRDVLPLLVGGEWKASQDISEMTSTFRLEKVDKQRPAGILQNVSSLLSFINTTISPPSKTPLPERDIFLADVQSSIFRSVLDNVLITSMPSSLSAIPTWLETVHSALDLEQQYSVGDQVAVIGPFFETQAGETWANQRRRRVGEDVRKLIIGGWGGWEAREAEREKEVVMVVEVEVDEPDPTDVAGESNGTKAKDDDGFGWGFDDEKEAEKEAEPKSTKETAIDVDADEWGFDDTPQAGRSSPRQSPKVSNGKHSTEDESMGDGWDFEDPVAAPASPPKPVATPKPAREAKRLGKKVAKAKAVVEDDPWASGNESTTASIPPSEPVAETGWGWDEPEPQPVVPADEEVKPVERVKRKELKEEKRTMRETFLVSRACDKLVDMAERVLQEAKELSSSS